MLSKRMYGSEIRTVNKTRVTGFRNVVLEKNGKKKMHRKEDGQRKVLGLVEKKELF